MTAPDGGSADAADALVDRGVSVKAGPWHVAAAEAGGLDEGATADVADALLTGGSPAPDDAAPVRAALAVLPGPVG